MSFDGGGFNSGFKVKVLVLGGVGVIVVVVFLLGSIGYSLGYCLILSLVF